MRVAFMGTPEFSVPILDALAAAGHDIAAVYCQPPRRAGRGRKERASPAQVRAEALGLTVRCPASLEGADAQARFSALRPDIAVVAAYGSILPPAILEMPAHGCLNVHASLLPRWRGAAPIHRAIMAGDATTGICIMRMEAGLDTGPVLSRRTTAIGATETAGELHDRLSVLGAVAIVDALAALDRLTPAPQPEDGVCYAAKIDKAEARIDWTRDAMAIDRQIRGLSPSPGAWTLVDGRRVRLLRSRLAEGQGDAGRVLDGFRIACGRGAVDILRVQPEGKASMSAQDWLRGARLEPGAVVGV